ncbi:MAG: DUF1566 domain-containing protein [Myxococcales bacterium]|nr:DUF1566 domain-containing protein [Myxococcales bacterium]
MLNFPKTVLLIFSSLLMASWAQAQAPLSYEGRLTDRTGAALQGPFDLQFSVYRSLAPVKGERVVYSEMHDGVVLDANGDFSAYLGEGTEVIGSLGTAVSANGTKYIEIAVFDPGAARGAVLSPRQRFASTPYVCVKNGNSRRLRRTVGRGGRRFGKSRGAAVEGPSRAVDATTQAPVSRFEACGDGVTVADNQTGLVWEKKTGTRSRSVPCNDTSCPDVHDVNNRYQWAHPGISAPDGGAFVNFLARLNGSFDGSACFANHCDWRMPEITELQTILVGMDAAEGQSRVCPRGGTCIDPEFRDAGGVEGAGGPTSTSKYWSRTTLPNHRGEAWVAFQLVGRGGGVDIARKPHDNAVRAVRTGSCGD